MTGYPGAQGAKKKPTAMKVLAGTYRKDRANLDEPLAKPAIPSCPRFVVGEARKEWRRVSRLLFAMGVLSEIDRSALAAYCQAWAQWVDAEQKLAKTGMLVSVEGVVRISPTWQAANQSREQMRAYLTEFGMTPASRARVRANKEKAENGHSDSKEKFFTIPNVN